MATGTIEIYQKETDIEFTFEVKYDYYPACAGDLESPPHEAYIEIYAYVLTEVEYDEEHALLNQVLSTEEIENLTGYNIDELDEQATEYICGYDW
jgi:hypothetical protein